MAKRKKSGDGIIHQIQNADVNPAPSDIQMPTIDDFKEMMTHLDRIPKSPRVPFGPPIIVAPENDWLKEKIQPGYMYQIGNVPWVAMTGHEGAKNYIDVSREQGNPDELTATTIFLCTDDGRFPITDITWHKNPKSPDNP